MTRCWPPSSVARSGRWGAPCARRTTPACWPPGPVLRPSATRCNGTCCWSSWGPASGGCSTAGSPTRSRPAAATRPGQARSPGTGTRPGTTHARSARTSRPTRLRCRRSRSRPPPFTPRAPPSCTGAWIRHSPPGSPTAPRCSRPPRWRRCWAATRLGPRRTHVRPWPWPATTPRARSASTTGCAGRCGRQATTRARRARWSSRWRGWATSRHRDCGRCSRRSRPRCAWPRPSRGRPWSSRTGPSGRRASSAPATWRRSPSASAGGRWRRTGRWTRASPACGPRSRSRTSCTTSRAGSWARRRSWPSWRAAAGRGRRWRRSMRRSPSPRRRAWAGRWGRSCAPRRPARASRSGRGTRPGAGSRTDWPGGRPP